MVGEEPPVTNPAFPKVTMARRDNVPKRRKTKKADFVHRADKRTSWPSRSDVSAASSSRAIAPGICSGCTRLRFAIPSNCLMLAHTSFAASALGPSATVKTIGRLSRPHALPSASSSAGKGTGGSRRGDRRFRSDPSRRIRQCYGNLSNVKSHH